MNADLSEVQRYLAGGAEPLTPDRDMQREMRATFARPLAGDRNQCPTCGLPFRSSFAFDLHRTGSIQKHTRRCMSTEEMVQRGMGKDGHGYWMGPRHDVASPEKSPETPPVAA